MKILNITNDGYLCLLKDDEIRLITGKKFYSDEFRNIMNKGQNIDLSKFNTLSGNYDTNEVNNAIKSLQSAITFLNNKKESLGYLNSLKETE